MTVDTSIPALKIAIIGGGPGGLATWIALSKVPNVEVTIYEKAKVLREAGAGISIGQNTWNVLELLGVADSLNSGHPTFTVLNLNGRTGEELHRVERLQTDHRAPIRTQRTKLQSALLSHIHPGVIQLSKRLERTEDLGKQGVKLYFADRTTVIADLVVGADGIRSKVRDCAWPGYEIKFTGTTIWRTLLPSTELEALHPLFDTTAWWHLPTSHVYFSPVGEGLSEIAAREYQDPAIHGASKEAWGVPVTNEYVESHFSQYLPEIRAALAKIPTGSWREFAAFSGPELSQLTAWNDKVVLVGDASHALSGAFGSGAGFAMEDGWVLAQALAHFSNDLRKALALFNEIRVPYYRKMYEHLEKEGKARATKLQTIESPSEEDRVRAKVIKGGKDMGWIYANNIRTTWDNAIKQPREGK